MKKMIAFLLAVSVLLSMSACQSSGAGGVNSDVVPANADGMAVVMGQTHSDYEGVSVQIESAVWDENRFVLKVDWINNTSYEAIFGESYNIERKDGDEWIGCQTVNDLVFNELAYILSPGQTRNEIYTVSNLFDVSQAGTYRFVSDFSIDDRSKQLVWAEFTLSADATEDDGSVVIGAATYGVQYVRTNGYVAGAKFPRVMIIRSQDELATYYEVNKDVFDLECKEEVYSDTTIGFLDACDQYDEAFFEKNYLIFVLLEEGSGSVRHEVRSVGQTSDKKISVSIDSILPDGAGTCDMAEWHIILELSRDMLVETPNDVLVYWGDTLRWDGDVVELPKPEPAFKEPPKATLSTPEGEAILMPVGYNWTVENNDGTANTTIADQSSRPLPQNSLEQVFMNNQYAETIYAAVPGTDTYAPTRSEGYLLKLNWEDNPDSVTFTSWSEDVWVNPDTPEETVYSQGDCAFYARTGGFIYEFVATWNDDGDGYHGTANYYVYVCDKYSHCAEPPV